jgi:hypothetical protein
LSHAAQTAAPLWPVASGAISENVKNLRRIKTAFFIMKTRRTHLSRRVSNTGSSRVPQLASESPQSFG